MKEDIMVLLNSMSNEDIKFGLELAKANNLFNEIKEELLPLAMPETEWCERGNSTEAEKRWCMGVGPRRRLYRCTSWDGGPIIYFE